MSKYTEINAVDGKWYDWDWVVSDMIYIQEIVLFISPLYIFLFCKYVYGQANLNLPHGMLKPESKLPYYTTSKLAKWNCLTLQQVSLL